MSFEKFLERLVVDESQVPTTADGIMTLADTLKQKMVENGEDPSTSQWSYLMHDGPTTLLHAISHIIIAMDYGDESQLLCADVVDMVSDMIDKFRMNERYTDTMRYSLWETADKFLKWTALNPKKKLVFLDTSYSLYTWCNFMSCHITLTNNGKTVFHQHHGTRLRSAGGILHRADGPACIYYNSETGAMKRKDYVYYGTMLPHTSPKIQAIMFNEWMVNGEKTLTESPNDATLQQIDT